MKTKLMSCIAVLLCSMWSHSVMAQTQQSYSPLTDAEFKHQNEARQAELKKQREANMAKAKSQTTVYEKPQVADPVKPATVTAAPVVSTPKPYVMTDAEKKAAQLKMNNAAKEEKMITKPQSNFQKSITQENLPWDGQNKELWILHNPQKYQDYINGQKKMTNIRRAELNKLSAEEKNRILSHPDQFNIID